VDFATPGPHVISAQVLNTKNSLATGYKVELDAFVSMDLDPVQRSLTVTTSGNGQGLVTSDPTGISCGDTCQLKRQRGNTGKADGYAGRGFRVRGLVG